jgi:hypothetical protein
MMALAVSACGGEDQPDPHSMDLAKQVSNSSPIAKRAKIQIIKATKRDYSFSIVYPTYIDPLVGSPDANDLIRSLIRKLVADGQQPVDQKITIFVWGVIIEPGAVGESGRRSDSYERQLFRADYYYGSDAITFEECNADVRQRRLGHCS